MWVYSRTAQDVSYLHTSFWTLPDWDGITMTQIVYLAIYVQVL